MIETHDIARAWLFVNGYDVPFLTPELREQWAQLIDCLNVEQFQVGARKSRMRRDDQLHLRPSIEAFKGYAGYTAPIAPRYDTSDTVEARRLAREVRPTASVASRCDEIRARANLPAREVTTGHPRSKTNAPCRKVPSVANCPICGWDSADHKSAEAS